MFKTLLLLIVIGYCVFRKRDNIEIIPAKTSLTDNFQKCDNGDDNYWTPLKYMIESLSNIRVQLISKNVTVDYELKKMIPYKINLDKHYNKINDSCSVITINDNDFPVMIRRKYEYQSFLKYLLYISGKDNQLYLGSY